MTVRVFINIADIFRYVCGQFVSKKPEQNITYFMRVEYILEWKWVIKASWALQKVCCVCGEDLRQWIQGKKKIAFWLPMIWREPWNHGDDCYVMCKDITAKIKGHLLAKHAVYYENCGSWTRRNHRNTDENSWKKLPSECTWRVAKQLCFLLLVYYVYFSFFY